MADREQLLRTYDEQLRTDAETPSAIAVTVLGPLRLVTFGAGRGFVTYRDLGGADAAGIGELVAAAVEHYRADPRITRVEWKTRGHDHAPGLHDALLGHGFVADETESIMVGEARLLDVEVPLPDGVALRRVEDEHDVRAMCAMQDLAFDEEVSVEMADAVLRRLALDDGMQLWVAEATTAAGTEIVSAGRLEPVAGSVVAGIWGGATAHAWRGRGIYRALTAARARAALQAGCMMVHSDSTEYSRPILERAGLVKVSTTTPYRLRFDRPS